jgi:thiamine kinase-like enzyme
MIAANPFDKTLPQLTTALNPEAMISVFSKALSITSLGFSLESCEIGRVKYKPQQNCLVYYTLYLKNVASQQIEKQIVCARFYAQDSYSRFEKTKGEAVIQTNLGQPIAHIPELKLILWVFPNDRKLHYLDQLTNAAFLKNTLLPQVISAHLGQHWTIASLNHQLVHYAPEHTCTVRIQLQLETDTVTYVNKEQELTLYGKTYYNEEGLETYRLMQLLWNSKERKQGLLTIAKPLSYHPEYKMLWQRGLAGTPLLNQDLSSKAFRQVLIQIAHSIATLHQTPLDCQKKMSLSDWQEKLNHTKNLLDHLQPALAQELESLLSEILKQAKHLEQPPKATLHGDLHLQNFLLYENKVSIIDLDNLCEGSPWQDIGSFIAGLYYRALLEAVPISTIESLSEIFCQAYALASPWKFDQDAVGWHTATALINERIYRSISRLKPGRLASINELIKIVKRLCNPKVES